MTATRALKLTKSFVDAIGATDTRQTIRDSECTGLILRVGTGGKKTWAYDYRDANGKRQTFTFGNAEKINPGDARKQIKTFSEDPAGDKRQAKREKKLSEQRTVRAYLTGDYWKHHLSRQKSGEATKKRILSEWSQFLDTDINQLKVNELETHRAERLKKGTKPSTLNRNRTSLLSLVNHAVEAEIISSNPIIKFKKLKESNDERVRWLGQRDKDEDIRNDKGNKLGERERLLIALEVAPAYTRVMAVLAMNTGMRRGEIFKLTWGNVDLARGEITIKASTAKTDCTRYIPLNQTITNVLKVWKKDQTESNVINILKLVFPNPETGKHFTHIKKSWGTVVYSAKVDDFRFHDLRHDFASRLVQSGQNLYEVQRLLGHSSIELTQRYAHVDDQQLKNAVNKLDDKISTTS
jgi:integrase